MRFFRLFPLLVPAIAAASTSPTIVHAGPVAPDILGIEIQAGEIQPIRQAPYEPQPGDRTEQQVNPKTGEPHWVRLIRDNRPVGFLVGRDRKILSYFETVTGDPLDTSAADDPSSYTVASEDDPGLAPARVWRKTKTNNWADSGPAYTSRHYLYLKFPRPLRPGARYTIKLRFATSPDTIAYKHEPAKNRSEAVHVSHIGFRPDDPGKAAFLSVWLGNGGAHAYPAGLSFAIREERSGKPVYSGKLAGAWKAAEAEQVGRKINYVKTDVYRMDFGGFRTPGSYLACVDSIGCSYPFRIAPDVWLRAFEVSMKGAYHHRSGIELGPPYTNYWRPRPFHPADGVKVYQSTCSLTYSGNGLNVLGTERNNFDCLVNGKTDKVVPEAWGGYMDAGDWDRRVQHIEATRLHLELFDLFPGYFSKIGLNIPESGNRVPDVVDEALFNLDHYRRLQTPEGGIRGGVESSEHPVAAETSWQESQTVMTYAPGIWETYIYAGVAARAASALRSSIYEDSAVRAIRWAEAEYARWKTGPDFARARPGAKKEIEVERNLAAVELYRLTGDKRWHGVFLEGKGLRSPDAAFVYARIPESRTDPAQRKAAIALLTREADDAVAFSRGNAFGIGLAGRRPSPYSGFYTVPASTSLVRAHALTGKPEYLEAIVRSAQFSAGANPMNMTMTTGLGHDYPRHPLHEDSRHSGQPAPSGITVYGPVDLGAYDDFPKKRLEKECSPPATEWPVAESYFDIYVWPAVNEYTVMQTIGPAAYVWGYLAARGAGR